MSKEKKIFLYPLVAIMSIIPFIVYMYAYDTGYGQYDWFSSSGTVVDFFLYYKSIAITIMAAIMAGVVVYQLVKQKKQIRFAKIFIPLLIYGGLTLISAILSVNHAVSFGGAYEQFESVWVLLGYVIITYYAFLIADHPDKIQFLLKGWFISIAVMCLLGLTQAIGVDFFATEIGKKLITSGDVWQQLSFNFEKGRVYLSLYNPNYVGSYVSLAFPLLLVLAVFQKDKKTKVFYGVLLAGCALCLLGSQSRTGILAIGVALILLAVLCRKQLVKYWKVLTGIIVLAIVLVLGFNILNGNVLFNRLATMFSDSPKTEYAVSAIDTGNDRVTMYYNDTPISFQYFMITETSAIATAFDENGQAIDCTYDSALGKYVINDSRFPGFTITPLDYGFCVYADGHEWNFTNLTDGTYYFVNGSGKAVKLSINDPQPNILSIFDVLGRFGGRDIIWSSSMPILMDSLLIGKGPDTFALLYPQEYYIYKTYNNALTSVDVKPHSLYLQIGIHSGVIALLAVLVFYGMYFVQSIRIYRKETFESYLSQAGVGIFIGTLAYMITGIANDSSVTVAPIFWALMGLGIGINYMLLKAEEKPVEAVTEATQAAGSKTKGTKKKSKK